MNVENNNRCRIEKLNQGHLVDGFDCGQDSLNRYLKRYALISQLADGAQSYVGVCDNIVIGYYTLVVGQVAYEEASERLTKGLSRNAVLVMLLARLATDVKWQGKRVGAGLLKDAMQRTIQAADIAGIRAFIVHAKNDKAKAFYEHWGFRELPGHPYRLFVGAKQLDAMMKAER